MPGVCGAFVSGDTSRNERPSSGRDPSSKTGVEQCSFRHACSFGHGRPGLRKVWKLPLARRTMYERRALELITRASVGATCGSGREPASHQLDEVVEVEALLLRL